MRSIYELPDLRPIRAVNHQLRLAGGAIVTQHGTLKSEDYVPGVSGWCVFGDGTVEFNDGTFRGEIDASGINIRVHETDDGAIEFYDADDLLVGRLTPAVWEIGDLTTPGHRLTLDPSGGLRFRSELDQLLNLIDDHGMTIRDEGTGAVVTTLDRDALRLEDLDGTTSLALSAMSADSLAVPRYKGLYESNPGTTVVHPTTVAATANDLSIGHAAFWRASVVQTQTHTPNGGWTEILDTKVGGASSLAIGISTLGPATGNGGTTTGTVSTWDRGVGTHVIVKGVVGGTTPTVRSYSDTNILTSANTANISMAKPTGTAAGDVLVAFIAMGNQGGTIPIGWTTPEGWVFLGATLGTAGIGTIQSTIAVGTWAYLADGTEGATFDTNVNFGPGNKTVHATMMAIQSGAVIDGGAQFLVDGFNTLGAWVPYTPVNTNVTVGNGTLQADYQVLGKTVQFRWYLILGSTTSFGGGNVSIGLPYPAKNVTPMNGWARDAGTQGAALSGVTVAATSSVALQHDRTTNAGLVNGTNPFTFGSGDSIAITGVYERV